VRVRFSAPVETGPGAHRASCTMGTGSFPGVKSGRGVTLAPNSLLGPWSRKGRDIPLVPLWAARTVQRLSVCTGVHFVFTLVCVIIYILFKHFCAIIYILILHFCNYLHTNYILVMRHLDNGHESARNMLFKNNNIHKFSYNVAVIFVRF